MAVIDVYRQYFAASGEFSGVRRSGALVTLTGDSEAGQIRYEAAVAFFPHRDAEDFAVAYDAFFSAVLYEGKGRRSKKKEQEYLAGLHETIDRLAAEAGAQVFWDRPLREAQTG